MSDEQPNADESAEQSRSAARARAVWVAAGRYIVIVLVVNLALVVWVMKTRYHVVGRIGAGMIIFANVGLMFAGAFCTLLVERASRGARLGAYQITVFVGPFIGYAMDAWLLGMWEASYH